MAKRSFPVESAQESGEFEPRPSRENFRGRTLLCPDDMVEHPPTTTGLVNVSEKIFLKLQKIAKSPFTMRHYPGLCWKSLTEQLMAASNKSIDKLCQRMRGEK